MHCAYCLWRARCSGEGVLKLYQNQSPGRGFKMQIQPTAREVICIFRVRFRNLKFFTSPWYNLAVIFWKTLLGRLRALGCHHIYLSAIDNVSRKLHANTFFANTAEFCVTGLSLSFLRGISDSVPVNSTWMWPVKLSTQRNVLLARFEQSRVDFLCD